MRQPKLNYKFHNPNTAQASAEYLTHLFIESGIKKVEQALKKVASDACGMQKPVSKNSIPDELEA